MISKWLSDFGDEFQVRVTSKASANKIELERQPDGSTRIRVYVTVTPEDNKANKAVIRMLAKALGVPQSSLTITQGLKSRDKKIQRKRR